MAGVLEHLCFKTTVDIRVFTIVNNKIAFESYRSFYNLSFLYNYNFLRVRRFDLFFIDYRFKLKYTRFFLKDFLVFQKKLKKKCINNVFLFSSLYNRNKFIFLYNKKFLKLKQ